MPFCSNDDVCFFAHITQYFYNHDCKIYFLRLLDFFTTATVKIYTASSGSVCGFYFPTCENPRQEQPDASRECIIIIYSYNPYYIYYYYF